MRLLFATTNPNKIPGVARALTPYGIEVVQLPLDIPELQAETAETVAGDKALWARSRVDEPVMVIDSALHIPALNGFPGPNVKWATKQLGLEGYLRLMSHLPRPEQRACWFEDALACVLNAGEKPKIFIRRALGRLAAEIRGGDNREAKSAIWKLFIPSGHDRTFAEMTGEELVRYRATVDDFYREFGAWFVSCRTS